MGPIWREHYIAHGGGGGDVGTLTGLMSLRLDWSHKSAAQYLYVKKRDELLLCRIIILGFCGRDAQRSGMSYWVWILTGPMLCLSLPFIRTPQ